MEQIRRFIEEAGWYENRRIDISYMIHEYVRFGFKEPNAFIQNVLMEFGNLRIEFKVDDGFCYDVCVNPDVGLDLLDIDDLPILEKIVGDNLLPIGSINSDHAAFLVSFRGKFYLLADNGIYYLADQFFGVCETVFLQKPMLRLI